MARTPSLVAIVAERMLHCKAMRVEMVSDSGATKARLIRGQESGLPKKNPFDLTAFRNAATVSETRKGYRNRNTVSVIRLTPTKAGSMRAPRAPPAHIKSGD
jgi:hypothetical protein